MSETKKDPHPVKYLTQAEARHRTGPAESGESTGDAQPGAAGTLPDRPWFVYLLACRNGAWYCGISTDVPRRYAEHLAGRGARYTRANPPVAVLGVRVFPDRSSALKAERELKRLRRADKLQWFQAGA